MSTTLAEIIEARRAKCDALEAALKLYPDAYLSGDYVCSDKLKREDCDYVFAEHINGGDILRAGKKLDGVVVCMPFNGTVPVLLVWDLCRDSPELYQKLVQLVAKR